MVNFRQYLHYSRRTLGWLVLAAMTLLLGLWLTVQWVVLHDVNRWRPWIVQLLSQSVGAPVTVDRLLPGRFHLLPTVVLEGVTVHDSAGLPGLQVQRIQARVDPWDFLRGRLDFDRLIIDQPQLMLRRDPTGALTLSGIPLPAPGGANSPFLDWLVHQGEIRVNGGILLWRDEQRHAPDLLLRQVDLDLRNGADIHRLQIDLVPPSALASSLHARLTLRGGDWGHWQGWQGRGRVDGARIDWAALAPWVDGLDGVQRATGSLHMSADLSPARGMELNSDIDFHPLVWRLSPATEVLSIAQLKGKLSLRWQGNQRELALHQVQWLDRAYPHGERPLDFTIRTQDGMTRIETTWLDVALLKPFEKFLPLTSQQRQTWDALGATGQVEEAELSWRQDAAWRDSLRFAGQLHHISFNACHGLPEVHSFSGTVTVTTGEGHIKGAGLASRWAASPWFVEPVDLQSFQLDVGWQQQAGSTTWDIHRLQLVNGDFNGQVSGTWVTTGDGPGTAHLQGRLTQAKPEAVWRYLPRQVPVAVRDWLHHAVTAGQTTDSEFSVDGDLDHFPFVQDQGGSFRVVTHFSGVPLHFDPDWPALSDVGGTLTIRGAVLSVEAQAGEIGGARIQRAFAEIADFTQAKSVLIVSGEAEGDVQGGLDFIAQSPLKRVLGRGLEGWRGSGTGHLVLALQLPLNRPEQSTVQGDYAFAGATLDGSKADIPPIEGIQGHLRFTERRVDSEELHARVLGGAAKFRFATDDQGIVHLDGAGQGNWQLLRRVYSQSLLNDVSGSEPWQAQMAFGAKKQAVQLWTHVDYLGEPVAVVLQTVDGQGLELRLWGATTAQALRRHFGSSGLEPLGAAVGWHGVGTMRHGLGQLRLEGDGQWMGEPFTFLANREADERFTASLAGHLAVAALQRWPAVHLPLTGVSGTSDWTMRVTGRSEQWEQVWLGSSLTGVTLAWPSPLGKVAGVALPLTVHVVNQGQQWRVEGQMGAWLSGRAVVTNLNPGDHDREPKLERASLWLGQIPAGEEILSGFSLGGHWPLLDVDAWQQAFSGVGEGQSEGGFPELNRFDVRLDKMTWHHRQWTNLRLSGIREGRQWALRARGPMMEGALTWVAEKPYRLTGQFSHLVWPKALSDTSTSALPRHRSRAMDMPALDVQIERLDWAPSFTGRLRVVGSAQGESSWRLQKLALESSSTQGQLEGEWQDLPQPHHHYHWQFKTDDLGRFLTDVGYPGLLQRGEGSGEGQLEWLGDWTDFDLSILKGEARLDLNDGQFSRIQPGGIGRLIGLFSLQTLPRRITLDFRDVFSDGFAFDHLSADLSLDHEQLTTRDFQMSGPAAKVSITGDVDLHQETTRLEAQVEPALGGSVALASAVVGGPVVGAASWLVQKILGNPFGKVLSYDYSIQGPWDTPDIQPIRRP